VIPARRVGCTLLHALVCMIAWTAVPLQADTPTAVVDLGDPRARVLQLLGEPLVAWSPSHCPQHRIELRRKAGLWLKLVYGPDDHLHAAGVFRLAMPSNPTARAEGRTPLHWPGLAPGTTSRLAYPPPERWRPLFRSMGAKQWLWMEESSDPTDPPGRSRYLGGVVVDDASGFASGTDFPYDVADAVTATPSLDAEWAHADLTQPLLAWRQRTPPNTYIETLDAGDSSPYCGLLTLAQPDYTDFKR